MRPLIVTQNITVDGCIEMLDDWFDPGRHSSTDNSDVLEEIRRQDADADALLVGRQTFEDFRSYWPLQTDDQTGITAYLNQVTKYVVSSTLTKPDWENSVILSGSATEEVEALKESDGLDIVCTGSITLTHELLRAGLVDEFHLFLTTRVVGSGIRFFPDGLTLDLELLEERRFASGLLFARYGNR